MTFSQELLAHKDGIASLETDQKHTRCSWCGNYGILNAMMSAIALEWHHPHEVILALDVWCSWNVSDKIEVNTIHGLHWRVLALASGIHCARPDMPVLCMAWDGATLSEWINHLIHTARNNYNVTFILHNNHNYGLTTGQASAATPLWTSMRGTVWTVTARPLEPVKIALTAWAGYVARWYSGDVEQLTKLIQGWMRHKWFAMIEVLQHCPTYWKATPAERYEKKIYDVQENPEYDRTDKRWAMRLVENYEQLATWLLYHDKTLLDFMSVQPQRLSKTTTPVAEVRRHEVDELLSWFVI